MGRILSGCLFALSSVLLFTCMSPQLASAQRPQAAIRIAESVLADTCELHSLLEACRADTFTVRSASRLESTVEALIEKLQCAHSEAAIAVLMDECSLWYGRTSVGVSRDCRLEHDRAIAAAIACIGRQLASLEDAVACFLRDSRPGVGHHSGHHTSQHSGHSGYDPRLDDTHFGGMQRPLPGRTGSWVGGQYVDPRGSSYPFGAEGYGHSGYAPSTQLRVQPGFGSAPFSQPSPYPTQTRPQQGRGSLGLNVLESVLSELARGR